MSFDFYAYFTSSFTHLIVLFVAFFVLVQLMYYWLIFSRLAFKKHKIYQEVNHPVSVIVCARNEYQNLKDFLPMILEQNYPQFEVLLINDDSDDETDFLTRDLLLRYSHFRVVNINRSVSFIKGKKFALSIGIKEAKYNHLLLTDADCTTASASWIKSMQAGFVGKNQIVVGYGRYEKCKGLLNKFVRFDTVHTAMQYLSFALAKIPYMGVGRNLSYTQELFEQQKGFTSHYTLQFGDDDLFVNKAARSKNTVAIYEPKAQTVSIAPKTWGAWFRQKKRHLGTGRYYRMSTKALLGLYSSSSFFFYLFLGIAIVLNLVWLNIFNLIILGLLYFIRLITQFIIYSGVCKKLEEKGILWLMPFFDFVFSVLNPMWAFSNVIIKQNKWK